MQESTRGMHACMRGGARVRAWGQDSMRGMARVRVRVRAMCTRGGTKARARERVCTRGKNDGAHARWCDSDGVRHSTGARVRVRTHVLEFSFKARYLFTYFYRYDTAVVKACWCSGIVMPCYFHECKGSNCALGIIL